ncbi:MAG: transposon-encoded TnpW family protein [Oscillospiraceae bacterium]|nr:transposon-encoded TnpW family protein [Oscillospiraceae bacterium]
MNTNLAYETKTAKTAITSIAPPVKVVERKIGRSVFIVSSRFNDNKQKDIVSTVARLIQNEPPVKPGA